MTDRPTQDLDLIARELQALGEPGLSDAEQTLPEITVPEGAPDAVRDVVWMLEVAQTPGRPLDPVSQRRVWNRVAARAPRPATQQGAGAGAGRTWVSVALGLAAAAVVVMAVRGGLPGLSGGHPEADPLARRAAHAATGDAAAIQALGDQARRGLDALGGSRGSARAADLAQDYARRWEQKR